MYLNLTDYVRFESVTIALGRLNAFSNIPPAVATPVWSFWNVGMYPQR